MLLFVSSTDNGVVELVLVVVVVVVVDWDELTWAEKRRKNIKFKLGNFTIQKNQSQLSLNCPLFYLKPTVQQCHFEFDYGHERERDRCNFLPSCESTNRERNLKTCMYLHWMGLTSCRGHLLRKCRVWLTTTTTHSAWISPGHIIFVSKSGIDFSSRDDMQSSFLLRVISQVLISSVDSTWWSKEEIRDARRKSWREIASSSHLVLNLSYPLFTFVSSSLSDFAHPLLEIQRRTCIDHFAYLLTPPAKITQLSFSWFTKIEGKQFYLKEK